jgi:hypothetical protein
VDIAEGLHQGDIEEQLQVGTGTDLGQLGRAAGGNLVHPEGERLGNLVRLDMQEVVEEDSQLVGIRLRDKVKLGDNHLELAAVDIVACKVVLEDKLVIEDKLLGSLEEHIEEVVIEDIQILQLQLELPSNSLEVP